LRQMYSFFHSPRESLYLFLQHEGIKHASDMLRDYSVYLRECMPAPAEAAYSIHSEVYFRFQRRLHHRHVLMDKTHVVLILYLRLVASQMYQCSLFLTHFVISVLLRAMHAIRKNIHKGNTMLELCNVFYE
jgi:hypothetical protein